MHWETSETPSKTSVPGFGTDNPGCGDEVRADGLAALAGEEALDLSHFSKKLRAMHGKLPVVDELADAVRLAQCRLAWQAWHVCDGCE